MAKAAKVMIPLALLWENIDLSNKGDYRSNIVYTSSKCQNFYDHFLGDEIVPREASNFGSRGTSTPNSERTRSYQIRLTADPK